MPVEIVNWIEIPVTEPERARKFYEAVFEFKIVDMEVGTESYACFPNKNGDGFSGALVQYEFTIPGRQGPLVYLNAYNNIDSMLERIESAGGKVIEPKKEIAPGFGFFALFEDSEGNMLALQSES
ncbi:VOC family protein [Flavitalea sp.]|nr:VOC family protein [Flavitalea sp.]